MDFVFLLKKTVPDFPQKFPIKLKPNLKLTRKGLSHTFEFPIKLKQNAHAIETKLCTQSDSV